MLLCETHHRLESVPPHLHPPPSLRLKSIPWQPLPLYKFVDPPTSYVFHRQLGEGGKDDGSFTVSSTKLEYSTSGSIGRHIVLSPDVVRALRFSMGLFLSIRPLLLFYQTQTNLERVMFCPFPFLSHCENLCLLRLLRLFCTTKGYRSETSAQLQNLGKLGQTLRVFLMLRLANVLLKSMRHRESDRSH